MTNGTNVSIIKEKTKKPITPITDNAISKVQKINIDGFTEEQNIFIQNQHKDFFGLDEKQSFQDLDVDIEDEENE